MHLINFRSVNTKQRSVYCDSLFRFFRKMKLSFILVEEQTKHKKLHQCNKISFYHKKVSPFLCTICSDKYIGHSINEFGFQIVFRLTQCIFMANFQNFYSRNIQYFFKFSNTTKSRFENLKIKNTKSRNFVFNSVRS